MKFPISNFQFSIIFIVALFGVLLLPYNQVLAAHVSGHPCDESLGGTKGIVPCGKTPLCPCKIEHIFILIMNMVILILKVMIPVAVLMLILGGVIFIFAGGLPEFKNWGKRIIFTAIIGLAIGLLSYGIVKAILTGLGYVHPIPF